MCLSSYFRLSPQKAGGGIGRNMTSKSSLGQGPLMEDPRTGF